MTGIVSSGDYQERLLAAVDRACAAAPDGWAYATEIAQAFQPGPISMIGMGQRLAALRTHDLLHCRPGGKDRLKWRRASPDATCRQAGSGKNVP